MVALFPIVVLHIYPGAILLSYPPWVLFTEGANPGELQNNEVPVQSVVKYEGGGI